MTQIKTTDFRDIEWQQRPYLMFHLGQTAPGHLQGWYRSRHGDIEIHVVEQGIFPGRLTGGTHLEMGQGGLRYQRSWNRPWSERTIIVLANRFADDVARKIEARTLALADRRLALDRMMRQAMEPALGGEHVDTRH